MDHGIIERLHISKSMIIKKIYASIAILLVSALLLSTVSFAWLTLSLAPEASDITTTLGANGNLEMALATSDHLATLEANDMYDDDSRFEFTTGNVVHDNVLWGNLIDLTAIEYGLHTLNMRPAVLNIQDGCIAEAPISVGKYSADGRLENFDADNVDLGVIGFSSVYDPDKAQYYAGSIAMSIDDLKAGNFDKEDLVQTILDNKQYGVRIAGLLDYSATADLNQNSANIDLLVDGYCFAIDLLFRTNAPTGNLMLQTEATQRMESEMEEEYVGGGSFIDMNNPKLSAAMKVVFANTLTGEIYALAQADAEGKLWITARADENGNLVPTAEDDAALIKPLTQNQVSAVTAWVFVDGSQVDNSAASTKADTAMKLNLQFSTDSVLNPAYTDKNTNPNYPNRPDMTDIPDLPDVPEIPEDAVYYFSNDGEGEFTIYTLGENGSRDYELPFTGSVDESTNTVTLNHVSNYPEDGIIVPAVVTMADSDTKYSIQIDPTQKPFADLSMTSAVVSFVPIDNKKVSPVATNLSSLFSRNEGTDFVSLDLSGLDTSTATDMSYMFYELSNLSYLDVSSFDTSNITNMECMFNRCSGLTELDVSGFDTSKVTDMSYMFFGCSGLGELDVSNFDTSNVTLMAQMFSGCKGLSKLDVSNFDTSEVTTMYAMFSVCTGLRELDVSGFDTSNVTNMNTMFSGCSSLTELDVSRFDTSKVTDMSHMFLSCSSLIELDVSNFNTASVRRMSLMFSGCSSLTELNVSEFNTANVTDMTAIFQHCSGLVELDLSGLDTSKVTDMSNMFYECSGLVELDLSGLDTSKVTDMSYMFYECSSLTALDVSGFDTANVTDMYAMFYECSSLTELDIVSFNTTNVKNMNGMFYNCSGLTELDVRDFDTANVTQMSYMFAGCSNLTELNVNGFDTANVEQMRGTFFYCSSLSEIDISNFDTTNVTDMSDMFAGCSGLTELDVSGFDTANVTNMYAMFYACSSLTELDISNFDASNVSNMDVMFHSCSNLQTIVTPKTMGDVGIDLPGKYLCESNGSTYTVIDKTVPAKSTLTKIVPHPTVIDSGDVTDTITWRLYDNGTLSIVGTGAIPNYSSNKMLWYSYIDSITRVTIGEGISSIGADAFSKHTFLTEVIIPDGVKSIGGWAFYRCPSLTAITLPDGLTTIGSSAFSECSSLTSIIIPDSVTSIASFAFEDCTSLTSIEIPDSVTSIETWAFIGCSGLTSIRVAEGNPVYHSDGNCLIETANNVLLVGCQNSIIPDGVTSIAKVAFRGCTGLTSITIPDSVTSIGAEAFFGCSNLTNITFEDTLTWYRTQDSSYSEGTETSVTNTTTNATYFKSKYFSYYWYKQ